MNFELDSAAEVLFRTPGTLKALLSGLSEPWVRGTEGPDTFSAFDVVGHLIDVAQVARAMAKQYGDQVGPWVPYLPVLTDRPVPQS